MEVPDIHEPGVCSRDADIRKEFLHLTPRCLIDVSKETILPLWVVLVLKVGANFINQLSFEDVLMSKEVHNFLFIHRHSLFVSVFHRLLLEEPSVL